MALSETTKESVPIATFLSEILGKNKTVELYDNDEKVDLYNDNQSAQKIASNPVYHRRTKHIDTSYHFLREKVKEGKISLIYANDNGS